MTTFGKSFIIVFESVLNTSLIIISISFNVIAMILLFPSADKKRYSVR